ncbi:phosphotransferase [Streptomyces sp. NPDC088254]|uniref:phosphotransferase n=1 Tax=Streptomyces sp. NPDC088254 TaxID=3365847 RepID=UPI00383027A2
MPGAEGRPGTRDAAPVDLGSAYGLAGLLHRRGERLDDYTRISVNAGRNVVVSLAGAEGNGVLIKQHRVRSDDRLPAERAVHEQLLGRLTPPAGDDRIFVPRLLGVRPEDRLLEFELVPGAVSLADRVAGHKASGESGVPAESGDTARKEGTAAEGALGAEKSVPVERFAELGAFIGEFHRRTSSLDVPGVLAAPAVDTERMQMVDFARLTPEHYAEFSVGELRLARTVQRDRALTAALARLSLTIEAHCLIHGDLRGENVLLPEGADDRMALIDWELCRFSDPAVDLGYFIGSLLHRVLYAVRAEHPTVDSWRTAADTRMSAVARMTSGFWQGYRRGAGDFADRLPLLALLTMHHAGSTMLSRIAGDLRSTGELTPRDLLVVGIARQLLVDPLSARVRFLADPDGAR